MRRISRRGPSSTLIAPTTLGPDGSHDGYPPALAGAEPLAPTGGRLAGRDVDDPETMLGVPLRHAAQLARFDVVEHDRDRATRPRHTGQAGQDGSIAAEHAVQQRSPGELHRDLVG